MIPQRAFGIVVAAIAAAFVSTPLATRAGAFQKDKSDAGPAHAHKEMFDRCAKACNDCQRICDACAAHCAHLIAKGKMEHMKTLRTCQDCAGICAMAAQIVARRGPFSDITCRCCAEACARCGKACAEHSGDQMMRACAEECRRCEEACRDMLKHIASASERTGR
jgi:hypothetical protein